jgi:hypothetical protein
MWFFVFGGGKTIIRRDVLLRQGVFLSTLFFLFTFFETIGVTANLCPSDINNDGKVDGSDLRIMHEEMGRDDCYLSPCKTDLNGDGKVDNQDKEMLMAEHGRTDCLSGEKDLFEERVDIVPLEQDEDLIKSEDEEIISYDVEEKTEEETELPVTRFIDNGDGTVTDPETGFMWTKDANLPGETLLFHQALAYINKVNKGEFTNFGYTDWRLPRYNELRSLIDFTKYSFWGYKLPLGHPFENVQSLRFYDRSSPTYLTKPDQAWLVNFYCRLVGHNTKSCYGFVWPVRNID